MLCAVCCCYRVGLPTASSVQSQGLTLAYFRTTVVASWVQMPRWQRRLRWHARTRSAVVQPTAKSQEPTATLLAQIELSFVDFQILVLPVAVAQCEGPAQSLRQSRGENVHYTTVDVAVAVAVPPALYLCYHPSLLLPNLLLHLPSFTQFQSRDYRTKRQHFPPSHHNHNHEHSVQLGLAMLRGRQKERKVTPPGPVYMTVSFHPHGA